MTFGYIGYIWALLVCGGASLVLFGSAALLYAVGRRGRAAEPAIRVESIPLRRDEDASTSGEA